ncbi:MAG: hypothetical protein K8T89_25765 [Planctomycetes bacterium]|nr:hypothetical protein [Planctomycetota bacterium]
MLLPRTGLALLLLAGLIVLAQNGLAADPAKDGVQPVVTDPNGKEVSLRKWKIVFGTRKIGWLPEKIDVFEVREFGSTTFKEGVLTLVPMASIQSIRYEYDKETAHIEVAGLDKPLQGTTKYKDINMITIEAEVDQGTSGVADLRYRGGLIKGGFKEVKFPKAVALAAPAKGELFSFLVAPEGKGKSATVMTATNVQALYRLADGTEKPLSWLMFKKTLKVEMADIQKLHVGEYNVKEKTAECDVQKKDGTQITVTLLSSVMVDGKPATLIGLMGQVPAGWKLFPIHTFTEFQPGDLKIEEKNEEPKKVETKKEEKKAPPKVDPPKKDEVKKDEPKKP